MPWPIGRRSRSRIWVVVLLVSVAVVVVSSSMSGGVSGVLQVLVPVQHALTTVSPSGLSDVMHLSATEVDRLRRKLKEYEHRLASVGTRVAELQNQNEELSRIRRRGLEAGRLIHAKIVARDSLPWRESGLLDEGTLAGIRRGDAVISRYFVTVGDDDGILDGMSVLSGETLLGEVTDVSTHTSRVLLLSDPASRPRWVRIASRKGDGFNPVPADFMLRGLGSNRMWIQGVEHGSVESGAIKEGDLVLTAASDNRLPVQVVIGTVVELRRDDDNAVLYDLFIEPAVELSDLKWVYVVDDSSG